jgi:hypothetical protein
MQRQKNKNGGSLAKNQARKIGNSFTLGNEQKN